MYKILVGDIGVDWRIYTNLKETGYDGVEWNNLAQNRDQWLPFATGQTVLGFHKSGDIP
jgi:hypothetical protein